MNFSWSFFLSRSINQSDFILTMYLEMFLFWILSVYLEKSWYVNKPFVTENDEHFFQRSFKYPISINFKGYLETTDSGIGIFQWCILEKKLKICWDNIHWCALKGLVDRPNPDSGKVFLHFIHCCRCSITHKSQDHLHHDGWTFSLCMEKEIASYRVTSIKQKVFLRLTIIFLN